MTNKEKYLEAFFKKNPQFKEKEMVKIMSRAMEKIISQAYDRGYRDGTASKDGENLFNSLFGNGGFHK